MERLSKKALLTGVVLLSAFGVFAQGSGSAGINEATQMVTSCGCGNRFDRGCKGVSKILIG